ncbi:MAG: efflux RND transporter periplasmic adaptor subunit, partial [Spirochaetota bacterium]
MEIGEMVREDSVITTLIDISSIYVSMNINERDLLAVKKGQRITFSADAFGEKKFSALVETLSPVLDVKSRTAEVKAISANSEGVLLPGMFVRGLIETGVKEQGIMVPSASVLKKDDGRCEVYVVKNSIVFRINVVIGEEIEGETRIIEGLSTGDVIITNGLNSVYQGMRIDD